MWEMKLGSTVSTIRTSGYFVRDDAGWRQWLEDNGFVFDVHEIEWEAARCALATYKELRGDMYVPHRFVVPSDELWPEQMWEMKLGRTVDSIRSQGAFVRDDPGRRQWLEDNGFVFDVHEIEWEAARCALATYKELRGDMHAPHRFGVPLGEPWPEQMWEMPLGRMVGSIRSQGSFVGDDPERRQVLDDMSFVWKVRASSAERNRDAAAHYGRVRRGTV